MKKYSEIIKNLSLVSQLGLSLIMPLLLCLFLCWLLVRHTGVGNWVYIIGFFFGLGGSAATAYKVWHSVINGKKNKGNDDQKEYSGKSRNSDRIGFNDHL